MNQRELIKMLLKMAKEHGKRLFLLKEIAILGSETEASSGMALLRAEKDGIVARAKNVWINMLDRPQLEELSLVLESPSYVSFESALYFHGILSQSPRGSLTVATTGRPRLVKTPIGDIQYIRLDKKYFFGFDSNRMALPEKAFLDNAYIQIKKGIWKDSSDVLYLDLLNKKKLTFFAKRFPAYVKKAFILKDVISH